MFNTTCLCLVYKKDAFLTKQFLSLFYLVALSIGLIFLMSYILNKLIKKHMYIAFDYRREECFHAKLGGVFMSYKTLTCIDIECHLLLNFLRNIKFVINIG